MSGEPSSPPAPWAATGRCNTPFSPAQRMRVRRGSVSLHFVFLYPSLSFLSFPAGRRRRRRRWPRSRAGEGGSAVPVPRRLTSGPAGRCARGCRALPEAAAAAAFCSLARRPAPGLRPAPWPFRAPLSPGWMLMNCHGSVSGSFLSVLFAGAACPSPLAWGLRSPVCGGGARSFSAAAFSRLARTRVVLISR